MIQQEELASVGQQEGASEDIIGHLLMEDPPHFKIPTLENPCLLREQIGSLSQDFQEDLQQHLSFSILQKEQSNCLIPEKPFVEAGEDDQILVGLTSYLPSLSTPTAHRRDSKIETRGVKIQRYRQKKKRRVWSRKICYDCRKVVADKRERINGRFVKKSPFKPGNDSTLKTCQGFQEIDIVNEFRLEGGGLQDCFL